MEDFSRQFLSQRHDLMAFIYGLARDAHVAEDVFQEVWMKLATAHAQGTAIDNQAAWCRTVAKNLVLLHWRRQRDAKVAANSALLEFMDYVARAFDETPASMTLDRRQALTDCVDVLPDKARRLLTLKYERGLSIQQIADEIGSSTDAVVKALLRLRQSLGLCVERKLKLQELGL